MLAQRMKAGRVKAWVGVARTAQRQQVRALAGLSAEESERKYIVPTYAKGGVRSKEGLVFESGKGCILTDSKGDKYVDFGSGIAVTVLGHGDAEWRDAVIDQMGKVAHVSNLYHTAPYLELAEKLVKHSPGIGKVFFCNSGTEATEGAIKFARVYQNAMGQGARNRFIGFKKSFHGRSLGALSLTYKPAIRLPFTPMLIPNVDHLEYNNVDELEKMIGPDVIAVMMEPVQGEGGINPASREFIKRARELCDEHGCMLIFDEVQIGLGRHGNGRLWAYEEYGVVPDAVTMAKPLANGLPIGAIMLSEKMYNAVPESNWLGCHGSTFAGNPLVTRAANVVVDKILAPGFLDTVSENGRHMIKTLEAMKDRLGSRVLEVRRPLGDAALYAGVQLPGPYAAKVVAHCLNNKVVVISAGDDGSVIRLCPPLVIDKDQIDRAMAVLEEAIAANVPEAAAAEASTKTASPAQLIVHQLSVSLASASPEEYESKLIEAEHDKLPLGFSVGTASLEFFPVELPRTPSSKPAKMNLCLIKPDKPTASYAALFTNNAFPGAPVRVGREIVKSGKPLAGVIINNKISNVHPRGSGVQDANRVCDTVAQLLDGPSGSGAAVFPSSTGVIGWQLPVDAMVKAAPGAIASLQNGSVLPAAKAIMTTDTYPKTRSCVIRDAEGNEYGRITGIAKGAGMIEPNMATMLVYLMTDIDADASTLDRVLRRAVNAEGSFNRISVDSDQSTSDTILLMSSQVMPKLPAAMEEDVLAGALGQLCADLAQDVVRNGEGTQHVLKVRVTGAPSAALAHGVGKAVVNSPLVKTAIAGNDANLGRIIAAVGSYIGKHNPAMAPIVASKCRILVGDLVVFENGEFCIDEDKEVKLAAYLRATELPPGLHYPAHYGSVEITIDLQGAERAAYGHSSMVFGSDLTHTYVDVNAGYRS